MGIFSKLKFWKKKDEFYFDKVADKELENDPLRTQRDTLGLEQRPLGLEEKSPFDTPDSGYPQQAPLAPTPQPVLSGNRDMELISSKLDTVKALLNSLDQRVGNIERSLGAQQPKKENKLW